MKTLTVLFLLLAVTVQAADYGVKTRFAKGKALTFPDCELVFAGTRKVSSPVYPRGFLFYDFKVASGGKSVDVSWSSGTGDIGPRTFDVNGKKFILELSKSDAFKGWLKDDELVLWREGDFRKIQKP